MAPITFATASAFRGSSAAGKTASTIETTVVARPTRPMRTATGLPPGIRITLGPAGLALHADERREDEEERKERHDDRHAHQDLVGPLYARPGLTQHDEHHRDGRLGEQGHPGRSPLRMEIAEARGEEVVDPRDEGDAGHGAQPCADASKGRDRDEGSGEGRETGCADPLGAASHGLHDSLQARQVRSRGGHEHAHRAHDVDEGDDRRGEEQTAGNRPARVANLVSHERGRLGAREREGDGGPEDHVAKAEARTQRRKAPLRRRSEPRVGHDADSDEDSRRPPAGDSARIGEPLSHAEPRDVDDCAEGEAGEGHDNEVRAAVGQGTPPFVAEQEQGRWPRRSRGAPGSRGGCWSSRSTRS